MKNETGFSKTLKIALVGVVLSVLMLGGQASAYYIDTFNGFPEEVFTQQDKVYSDFSDVNSNYSDSLNITTITTQIFGTPPVDVHTVSFGGIFGAGLIYDFRYTIAVNNPLLFINKIGVGIDQSFGTGAPATIQKIAYNAAGAIVYDSGNVTGNVADFTLATPLQFLSIEDILTVGQSKVNSVTNSVTETGTTVPEPATMLLLGLGLIGLAGARRKFKK